jgi:hypothetical protein
VIVLQSPATFAQTGLPACPSEKSAAKLVETIIHDIISRPVSTHEYLNRAHFSMSLSILRAIGIEDSSRPTLSAN